MLNQWWTLSFSISRFVYQIKSSAVAKNVFVKMQRKNNDLKEYMFRGVATWHTKHTEHGVGASSEKPQECQAWINNIRSMCYHYWVHVWKVNARKWLGSKAFKNPLIGGTCVHFMRREERTEQRRRHQAITKFVCVCVGVLFLALT